MERRASTSTPRSAEAGFTLIELMIVVAIIAVLASVLIPNFVSARAQAQTSACESNLRSIATAMELYYTDNQHYPGAGDVPAILQGAAGGGVTPTAYLATNPRDPADPQNRPYRVANGSTGDTQSYVIVCPGTHNGATLAKLTQDGGAAQCGGNCANGGIAYRSGVGVVVGVQY